MRPGALSAELGRGLLPPPCTPRANPAPWGGASPGRENPQRLLILAGLSPPRGSRTVALALAATEGRLLLGRAVAKTQSPSDCPLINRRCTPAHNLACGASASSPPQVSCPRAEFRVPPRLGLAVSHPGARSVLAYVPRDGHGRVGHRPTRTGPPVAGRRCGLGSGRTTHAGVRYTWWHRPASCRCPRWRPPRWYRAR